MHTHRSIKEVIQEIAPLLVAVALGTLCGAVEGWGALDSVYFAFISAMTIGYGDLAPSTHLGRALTMVYLPVAVVCTAHSVRRLSARFNVRRQGTNNTASDANRLEDLLMRCLDDHSDVVTEAEFVCRMLVEMDLVHGDAITKIREQCK